jgi:hypothetical protein
MRHLDQALNGPITDLPKNREFAGHAGRIESVVLEEVDAADGGLDRSR